VAVLADGAQEDAAAIGEKSWHSNTIEEREPWQLLHRQ
jgi:hypothetical protein